MKKKFLTLICVSIMALSLVGCDKEKKDDKKEKETTEASMDFEFPGFDTSNESEETDTTEEITEELTTEALADEDGWIMVGSDRTGYAEVPDDWTKHESEADGGEKYSLQYLSPGEDGLVSLIDNDYDFDENQYEVEDPADVVAQAYVEQYGSMGATNEGVESVEMDGINFYKTIDVLAEGTYKDYEYVLYTYVGYYEGKFYTVAVEGERSMVEEISERVEETYSITGDISTTGSTSNDINDTEETQDTDDVASVDGKTDWETYYANVDGDEYTLPCDFSEFAANGWSLDDSGVNETIDYEDYTYVFVMKGEKEFYLMVANKNSETPIAIEDGQVIGVVYDFRSEGMEGNIEGGITIGSSYETVIAAFGTPDDVYEDDEDDYKQLTYFGETMETDWYTKLEIIVENGKVTNIEMVHW